MLQHSFLKNRMILRVGKVMGSSYDAMDDSEEDVEENVVNRQTALLSLDVLARVLGSRHQGAFVGVLDDLTEIVGGNGPGALPGKRKLFWFVPSEGQVLRLIFIGGLFVWDLLDCYHLVAHWWCKCPLLRLSYDRLFCHFCLFLLS